MQCTFALLVVLVLVRNDLACHATLSTSTQTLNMSTLHAPSTLPVFGGYSGSEASPTVPPISYEGKVSDSCPDDIRENQIQYYALEI